MKSFRKELVVNIPSRRGFLNITPQVEACLRESGITEGLVLVNTITFHSGITSHRSIEKGRSAQLIS
jgi:thiamine phosphate synthase YjbQ (UPF0047 family)